MSQTVNEAIETLKSLLTSPRIEEALGDRVRQLAADAKREINIQTAYNAAKDLVPEMAEWDDLTLTLRNLLRAAYMMGLEAVKDGKGLTVVDPFYLCFIETGVRIELGAETLEDLVMVAKTVPVAPVADKKRPTATVHTPGLAASKKKGSP